MKKIVALVLFISSFVFCTERVIVTCNFEAVADGFEDIEITNEMIIVLDSYGEIDDIRNIDGSSYSMLHIGGSLFIFPNPKYTPNEMVIINDNIINKAKTKKDAQQFVYKNFIRNGNKLYATDFCGEVMFFIKRGIIVKGEPGKILENEYGNVECKTN